MAGRFTTRTMCPSTSCTYSKRTTHPPLHCFYPALHTLITAHRNNSSSFRSSYLPILWRRTGIVDLANMVPISSHSTRSADANIDDVHAALRKQSTHATLRRVLETCNPNEAIVQAISLLLYTRHILRRSTPCSRTRSHFPHHSLHMRLSATLCRTLSPIPPRARPMVERWNTTGHAVVVARAGTASIIRIVPNIIATTNSVVTAQLILSKSIEVRITLR
jgi:hypothetical protein